MPNSPMPMLEVCDWLLLMMVSMIDGSSRVVQSCFVWYLS
jgi:hypothetical protein